MIDDELVEEVEARAATGDSSKKARASFRFQLSCNFPACTIACTLKCLHVGKFINRRLLSEAIINHCYFLYTMAWKLWLDAITVLCHVRKMFKRKKE